MFVCDEVTAAVKTESGDPRFTGDALRCIPGDDERGTVLLVGVVHDHPASTYRVATVLESVTPDFLAVELPPLAVPLFELYARDVYTPPRLGGEMSMAIQAAEGIEPVGIDGPNWPYLRTLFRNVVDHPSSSRVILPVLKDIVTSSAHALTCRLGALIGAASPLNPRVYSHIEYETTLLDSPSEQASHERSYLSQQRTFLHAVTVPDSIQVIDRSREESMVSQLQKLRTERDGVAIVGMEHLDTLEQELSKAS